MFASWGGDELATKTIAEFLASDPGPSAMSDEESDVFYQGEQWDPAEALEREAQGKICLVHNVLLSLVYWARALSPRDISPPQLLALQRAVTRRNAAAQRSLNRELSDKAMAARVQ